MPENEMQQFDHDFAGQHYEDSFGCRIGRYFPTFRSSLRDGNFRWPETRRDKTEDRSHWREYLKTKLFNSCLEKKKYEEISKKQR